ncbi:cupin [Spirochaetia bacterium]|nr:cupin [Spirochaetia bacterium]
MSVYLDSREDPAYWINELDLKPHNEGGWYRETWLSDQVIPAGSLPPDYGESRRASSLIYYLLRGEEVSRWHKVRSAEIWLWHAGGLLELSLGGRGEKPVFEEAQLLGSSPDRGALFQRVVGAGVWQSAKIREGTFVLVSCAVSPAFHWKDFTV